MLAPNRRPGTWAPTTVGRPPKSPLCIEVAVFTVLPSCRSLLRCPTTLRPLRPCSSTCLARLPAMPLKNSRRNFKTLLLCQWCFTTARHMSTIRVRYLPPARLVRLERFDPCTSPLLPDFVELGSLNRLHFDKIFFLFHFSHLFSYGTKWIEW